MCVAWWGVDACVGCEINMGFPLRHVRDRVNSEKILTGVTNGPTASVAQLASASADRETPCVVLRPASLFINSDIAALFLCLFWLKDYNFPSVSLADIRGIFQRAFYINAEISWIRFPGTPSKYNIRFFPQCFVIMLISLFSIILRCLHSVYDPLFCTLRPT